MNDNTNHSNHYHHLHVKARPFPDDFIHKHGSNQQPIHTDLGFCYSFHFGICYSSDSVFEPDSLRMRLLVVLLLMLQVCAVGRSLQ